MTQILFYINNRKFTKYENLWLHAILHDWQGRQMESTNKHIYTKRMIDNIYIKFNIVYFLYKYLKAFIYNLKLR